MANQDISAILTDAERARRTDRAARLSTGTVSAAASTGNETTQGTVGVGLGLGTIVYTDEQGRIPAELIPAGAGGGTADAPFEYTQVTPSAVWVLNHQLGGRPSVRVLDGQNREINPGIEWPDDDTVIVRFGRPTAGKAEVSI